MLHQLRSRLIKANVTDVSFTIITTPSPLSPNDNELRHAAKSIPVRQRAAVTSSWNNILEDQQNNILVLDRCGRLTYQVVMPWSILHYPYVKAAILSTAKDTPCGPCEENVEMNQNNISSEDETPSSFGVVESKLSSIVKNHAAIKSSNKSENVNVTLSVEQVTKPSNSSIIHSSNMTPTINNITKSTSGEEKVEPVENKKNKHEGANKKNDSPKTKHGKKKNKNEKKTKIESESVDQEVKNITKQDTEDQIILSIDDELAKNPNSYEPDMNKLEDDNYDPTVTIAPLSPLPDGRIPIRVIMHDYHQHNGIDEEYLERQLGNPHYHGHLDKHGRRIEANEEIELDQGFETRNDTKETVPESHGSDVVFDEEMDKDGDSQVEEALEIILSSKEKKDGNDTIVILEKDKAVIDAVMKEVVKDDDFQVEEEKVLENIPTLKEEKVGDATVVTLEDDKAVIDAVIKEPLKDLNQTSNDTDKVIKEKVEKFVSTVLGRKELFLEDVLFSSEATRTSDGNDWRGEDEENSFEDGKNIPWDDSDYTIKTPVLIDYWPAEENSTKVVNSDKQNVLATKSSTVKNKYKQGHKNKETDGKKEMVIDGDEIVEESDQVEKKRVMIKPKQYNSKSSSSEDSANERVKIHYSKMLPWVNFKI